MKRVLMPATAYRRTYLADRLDDLLGRGMFGAFLRQLSPASYALVQNASPNQQAYALLEHLNNHYFPIDRYAAMQMQESTDEGDLDWEDLRYLGIPVEVFGFSDENDCDDRAAQVCLALGHDGEARDNFANVLPAEYRGGQGKPPKCPRGRQWLEPWDAIGLLFDWVHGATQIRWLDYNVAMLEESSNPPWDMDEIRALTADWKRAEPQVKRLNALRELINRKHSTTAWLAGALVGDKEVISNITRPTRAKKTLAEVWQ